MFSANRVTNGGDFMQKWVLAAAASTVGLLGVALSGCEDNRRPYSPEPKTAAQLGQEKRWGYQATTLPADPNVDVIRDEGLNHSQAMATLDYLCNVIGPRLTVSPNAKRANDWTRDTLESWGLTNAHLEAWGPFGRGWEVRRYSMQVVEPMQISLIGYPKAWSPGLDGVVEAEPIWVDAQTDADLEKYRGMLKGRVVMVGAIRQVEPRFQPLAERLSDEDLAKLAASGSGDKAMLGQPQPKTQSASDRRAIAAEQNPQLAALMRAGQRGDAAATMPTSMVMPPGAPTSMPTTMPPATMPAGRIAQMFALKAVTFAAREGAALVITPSPMGDGGTFFVQGAAVPGGSAFTGGPGAKAWDLNGPAIPPQVTLAVEDFNRLARMIRQGQTPKLRTELEVKFEDENKLGYNTVAEIQGTDLKDQVVMVGAHLDSWHSGTGATDNGVGSAAAMEAVRIIKASKLKPRRTIRIALWTGEEQGLFGSEAYVKQHVGYDRNTRPRTGFGAPTSKPTVDIVKGEDFEKISVYFNLDNGTGKIRGVYAQGNSLAAPIFAQWLQPFADLGASTVTMADTGGTDHLSFDAVGVPGFQFIQDTLEYSSRTHHSNEDNFDRIQAGDLKQASTILADFLYKAAMMDERFPRK